MGALPARARRSLEIRDPRLPDRVQRFPESVIREMTRVAEAHGAVNLPQGVPDYDPPREVVRAARRALENGRNQYSTTWGAPELREAIARRAKAFNGIDADPDADLVVTCGSTEALMAAYEVTEDREYLAKAERISDLLIRRAAAGNSLDAGHAKT